MAKRILLVDDEPLARQRLRRFLAEREDDLDVHEAENGVAALALIPRLNPDVVLLDVAMPGCNGFELLARLPRREFAVIFQTAYDEFALKAFDENACDYLLKPFTSERFRKALDRALGASKPGPGRIVVKNRFGLKALDLKEVLYCISRDHVTHVGTATHEYSCDASIETLSESLPADQFRRIHRNSIVRLDAVTEVRRGEGMEVRLSTGLALPVARPRRREFLEKFRPLDG